MCKHFFLIDDDEDELEIFMEALSKLNFACKCTYAQRAEQALDILNYLKPDVVFVDIDMPDLNGFECVKQIRAKEGHQHTRLLIYSNSKNDINLETALACGASGVIKKTTSISALVSEMRQHIESSRLNHVNQHSTC